MRATIGYAVKAGVAALALPLAACASGGDRPPPGAGAPEAGAQAPGGPQESPGFFARLLGAGSNVPNAGPCPIMGVLYDAARVVEFKQPEERFASVGYTAEMRGVRGLCRYVGGEPIELALQIDMAFGRGPMAEGQVHTYRYWVAVTRLDVAPLAKQYFDIEVRFPPGADRVSGSEVFEKIIIPRANETISGANFEVLVGFDLTPEQLAFNREGKRFRVDAGG